MSYARSFRLLAGTLTATVALSIVGISAAEARPTKPGGITGLQAQVTPGNGTYDVAATWNAATNATSYRATITKAGTTLASKTLTSPSWSPTLTTSPGTATLSVKALTKHRPGKTSSISLSLDDVTAPHGSYSSGWDNDTGIAMITQDSLTDDSPVGQVTRTVNWDDGSAVEPWTTGTTLNHTYPLTEQRYVPTVTLEDAAHNIRVVDASAVVINDLVAPTGTFSVAPATGWAKLTRVTVSQSALHDNWSPANKITRSVDWGDGAITSNWTGANIKHVYTTGGTYSPVVTITDEASNSTEIATSDVTVNVDAAAPLLRLLLPKSHRHSVTSWRTLRGKATDTAGTGVEHVSLRAVEKRGNKWFGYRPATKTWVKAATKAGALKRSRAFTLITGAHHRWSAHLAGLRKGTLVYKTSAVDQVKNSSRTLTHKATLTKP